MSADLVLSNRSPPPRPIDAFFDSSGYLKDQLEKIVEEGNVEDLKMLLQRDDISSSMLDSALDIAPLATENANAVVELLLAGAGIIQKMFPTSHAIDSKLNQAIWEENRALASLLWERGFHTSQSLNLPFSSAARKANTAMVDSILSSKTPPTPLTKRRARDTALFFSTGTASEEGLYNYVQGCRKVVQLINASLPQSERETKFALRSFSQWEIVS